MFNIETIESNNKLIPICLSFSDDLHYNNIWFETNKNDDVLFFILNNFKHNKYYYTYNLLFNFLLLINSINRNRITFNWVFIDYKLYEVILNYNNNKICLRCAYKLIPFALDKFYPIFSLTQKLFFPYEIQKTWDSEINCSQFKLINKIYYNLTIKDYYILYSKTNIKILYEGLLNFFNNLKFLNIYFSKKNLSCGSISFNFYLKKFNKINLNIPISQKNIFEQAYFGGKCEVYGNKQKNEKILHFDFSGMYYTCMKEKLPYGDFYSKNDNFNLNEPGYYHIEIIYKNKYPILPLKSDKLYFKEGHICGWFWFEEIKLTLEYSTVSYFKINYGLISKQNDYILYEFLEYLNKFKDDFSIKKHIGKLLINSFYGRLALKNEINIMSLVENLDNNKCYGIVDDFFLIKKKSHKIPKSNIAIAAAIASKARIKLYKAQMEVINNGGRLLYSDTDSIFAAFPTHLTVENKLLGEYIYFDTNKFDTVLLDAVFISSKTYATILSNNTEVIKIKGVNTSNINFQFLQQSFFSGQEYIDIDFNQFLKKNLNLKHIFFKKNINLQDYNKRIWIDQKYNTIPIYNH